MSWTVKGILLGMILTPACFFLAMLSAGAGHGNYILAKLLYPFPILATLVGDVRIPIALAFLQFPAYGALVGYARTQGAKWYVMVAGVLHLVAVVATFLAEVP